MDDKDNEFKRDMLEIMEQVRDSQLALVHKMTEESVGSLSDDRADYLTTALQLASDLTWMSFYQDIDAFLALSDPECGDFVVKQYSGGPDGVCDELFGFIADLNGDDWWDRYGEREAAEEEIHQQERLTEAQRESSQALKN